MREQSGKSPLGWLITIVIALLIVGVSIAMIFVDNEEFLDWVEEYKNRNNTVQTQENKG